MKTIRLDIDDSIFDKVMYFLNHLPKKDVRVKIEEPQKEHKPRKLTALSIKTKGFEFDREEAHAR
jgi:hypothetical protein